MGTKVRISVGNLATRILIKETGDIFYFGILSVSSWKKGIKRFQALGGGSEITAQGKNKLETLFGAEEFEGTDARFIVDEKHLEAVLSIFEERDTCFSEVDASREIVEEFCNEELQDLPVILSVEDASKIEVVYRETVRQKLPTHGKGTPTEGSERVSIQTRRLFHLFDIVVPFAVFKKIKDSEAIRILEKDELATTNDGTCTGKTKDGIEIANNLFEV